MSKLLYLVVISGYAYAQVPVTAIRKDSIPEERRRFTPGSNSLMPTVRTNNAFYRDPKDGPRVVRATLDNMPIKGPDSAMSYTMPRVRMYPRGPAERPNLKLFPPITPKK